MFFEKCKNRFKGRAPVSFLIIAVMLLSSVLTGCAGNTNTTSGTPEPSAPVVTETPDDDAAPELPELAPDSEEDYEAFLDKLEYLALGDEAEENGAASENAGDAVTGDAGTAVESDSTATDDDTAVEAEAAIGDTSAAPEANESNGASIASTLSTTDFAKAMDFEWLHDVMEYDGTGAGIILDASQADPIPADDNSYLNGGWKAYMYGTDSDYGERYLNAEIDAQGEELNITLNWKYFYLDGISHEENGSSTFSGQRDPSDGVATAAGSSGNLELAEFYISKDQKHEYALGAFQWPSGELFFLGLMR